MSYSSTTSFFASDARSSADATDSISRGPAPSGARSGSRPRALGHDTWKLSEQEVPEQSEVLEWVRAYQERGCIESRDRVIASQMRLVASIARRYSRDASHFDDLMAEGAMCLLRAVDLYNPSRGVAFSAYVAAVLKEGLKGCRSDARELVRSPRARKGVETVRVSVGSFGTTADGDRSGGADWLSDNGPSPSGAAELADDIEVLHRAIKALPPESASLVCKRFGLMGERDHSTMDLCASLGMTRQMVAESTARAVAALRTEIARSERTARARAS